MAAPGTLPAWEVPLCGASDSSWHTAALSACCLCRNPPFPGITPPHPIPPPPHMHAGGARPVQGVGRAVGAAGAYDHRHLCGERVPAQRDGHAHAVSAVMSLPEATPQGEPTRPRPSHRAPSPALARCAALLPWTCATSAARRGWPLRTALFCVRLAALKPTQLPFDRRPPNLRRGAPCTAHSVLTL